MPASRADQIDEVKLRIKMAQKQSRCENCDESNTKPVIIHYQSPHVSTSQGNEFINRMSCEDCANHLVNNPLENHDEKGPPEIYKIGEQAIMFTDLRYMKRDTKDMIKIVNQLE